MKKKHILFLLFSVLINTLYSQIVINEYSAANYESHLDNYGEYEDWIELYNTTSTDIDLNGWFLSDKTSNTNKWQFMSSYIISANSVGIIYCSGNDEVLGGFAHTNFKITQTTGNEVFILSDPSSIIIDSITVIPNLKSHSRGRDVNGGSSWSVFTSPTPNMNNTWSNA